MLRKVLDDCLVTLLFEYVEVLDERLRNIRAEVFPLVTWSELLKFVSSIMEKIYKTKVQYKVTLTKKEKN